MVQRAMVVFTTIAHVSLTPSTASAWSNGVDGSNPYGTHDWILDQALRAPGGSAGE